MSDIFRYVLQSDKKGLVTLGEEMEFVKAFFYMMEIRFANKLVFKINVANEMSDLKLPVLSLLPLIDNVVVHNIIDSEHKMEVSICMNKEMELSVSNPVYPKLSDTDTNGTGLKNLENRFLLLMNKQIRVNNDGTRFTVYLPLKKEKNENTDS
jgi:LytS/YehU family sensor histidine kinase